MILVKTISHLKSGNTFTVELLTDGTPKKYRLAVETIQVNGKTIERIVCEDGLTQLLHACPSAAGRFFAWSVTCITEKRLNFRLTWFRK